MAAPCDLSPALGLAGSQLSFSRLPCLHCLCLAQAWVLVPASPPRELCRQVQRPTLLRRRCWEAAGLEA